MGLLGQSRMVLSLFYMWSIVWSSILFSSKFLFWKIQTYRKVDRILKWASINFSPKLSKHEHFAPVYPHLCYLAPLSLSLACPFFVLIEKCLFLNYLKANCRHGDNLNLKTSLVTIHTMLYKHKTKTMV